MGPYEEFHGFALLLCELARIETLRFFNDESYRVDAKSDSSPVTDADLAAERTIRQLIEDRYPEHGILGEEFDAKGPEREWLWTIDPIDGTENFARGIPTFGTMVALKHEGRPVVGVLDHPAMGVTVHAAKGRGAFWNKRKLTIGSAEPLQAGDVIATSNRKTFERSGEGAVFDALHAWHGSARMYYDCFSHSLAARGSLAAVVEFNLAPWDLAPSEIIIREAGGEFVTVATEGARSSAVFGRTAAVRSIVEYLQAERG